MNSQNILKFYGSKLDIILDYSEFYDYIIDNKENVDLIVDNSELYDFELITIKDTPKIDIVLDYSELYDFELTNELDYQNAYIDENVSIINLKPDNYFIMTVDYKVLKTQDNVEIQFEF
jgi:hypothetical protein